MKTSKVHKESSTYDFIGFLDPETKELITMSDYGVNNHGDLAIEMGYGGWQEALDEGYIRVAALNAFELPDFSDLNLGAVEACLLNFINTYPAYFKGENAQYVYIDSMGGNLKSAKISDVMDTGLKDALTSSMTFAKKKKDSPLGYGIDELKEISQGDQEEIYRIDRNSAKSYKYWVTPNDDIINIGDELHNEWAMSNQGRDAYQLHQDGWIRITDDQLFTAGEIYFDLPSLTPIDLKRVDFIFNEVPDLMRFPITTISYGKDTIELDTAEVLKRGTVSALKRHQRETKMAEKRVEIPMMFLNKYFGQTLDTQAFNGIRDAVANVVEKNEHYFLDLGAEPREIVQLESEIKMASTPGILDTALEKLYSFGEKYGIEFKSDMQKGSAVTPSRVFHKLLQAWKTASSPTWVPKIDRALENVSIEFNDGTRMSVFDDNGVNMFLKANKKKAYKEFNKMWIDPSGKKYTVSGSETHDDVISDIAEVPDDEDGTDYLINEGWIRKGESTDGLLYFSIFGTDPVHIEKLQNYLDSEPELLDRNLTIEIDFGPSGSDRISFSTDAVAKKGLASVVKTYFREVIMASKKSKKIKTISSSGYQVGLLSHLNNKLGQFYTDLSTMDRLAESGYKIAGETILDSHLLQGNTRKTSGNKVDFDILAKHLDDYNASIGHSLYSDTDVFIFKISENIPSEGTDEEKKQDEELLLINATVTALNNRGFEVTAEDYIEWMTGSLTTNEGAERFTEVVLSLLTEKVYNVYKQLNLLNAKLRFELGVGPPYVDGVDLSINPEFSNVPEVDGCPIQPGEPPSVFVMNVEM